MPSLQQKADLKSLLLQQLQQKKQKLKQMEQKCALQNKKIKLYRKENEQLQGVIEQMNQSDTNLLLGSKELLGLNGKMEKTIFDLRVELERVKRVDKIVNIKSGVEKKGIQEKLQIGRQQQSTQSSTLSSKDKQAINTNIPLLSLLSIRQSTVTQSTLQIDLPNCQLTDQQFTQLQSFPQLKSITVNDNLLTNQSVSMICTRFKMLEKLNLANNKFDSQGIQEIGNLVNLITLDVRNNNLGDQGMSYISQVKKLAELSCSKNNITDKALPQLSSLKQLTYLDITNNFLTSQSVNQFIKLQKLTHLYLMSNKLNKSSIIAILKSLKSLRFLDVRFNVWNNQEKTEIRANKPQNIQVFC